MPIKVEQGLLQGTSEDGLTVYRGVPYAAPPVGDLRWREPQPAVKWDGVRLAEKVPAAPWQADNWMISAKKPDSPMRSEDCLFLNVWTPARSPEDRVPVMVWIHGGGFSSGSIALNFDNGEHLAKKGVVVVLIGYRVGQLGFLAHPELSAESPHHVSGNYGLLDTIAALKWIQTNISAFGGDPNKVTIFGESAGGIAVSMLCASPQAKGLFHGAISQSGGSFGPVSSGGAPGENMKPLADAERAGEAYVKAAGVASIAELRKIPPEKLSLGGGWPVVDGYVIPDDQYKLYAAGKYNDTPVLIGYNSDEGASFFAPKTTDDYISAVNRRYGKFADALLKAYPPGTTTVAKTARDLTRDSAFGWHNWTWARLQTRTGKSKVFYYYFDQHPDFPEGSPKHGYGASHAADVGYVFQHLDTKNPEYDKSDGVISDAMSSYWTNFAKHGDPNAEGLPNWPAFDEANPQVMYFDKKPYTGPVPSVEGLKVLDEYFAWRRSDSAAGK